MHLSIKAPSLLPLLFAASMSTLLAGCDGGAIGSTSTGTSTGTSSGTADSVATTSGTTTTEGANATTITTSTQCTTTGLAATDLTGRCRATPQSTIGALEAFDGSVVATTGATTVGMVSLSGASTTIQPLIVAWQPAPDAVAGYVIYYGSTPDTANALLSELSAGSYNPSAPSIAYDPVRDLGMSSGDSACFRIYSYDSSRTLSAESQLVCSTV